MSPFEQLPREIRDLIYENCLLCEGEIVPFLNRAEQKEAPSWFQVSNATESSSEREPTQNGGLDAFLGDPAVCPRINREALQAPNKPCVALLGVNSTIRDEAVSILFGKNVWRLSSRFDEQDGRYRWWKTYAKYFRHVVASFDACDHDEVEILDIAMEEMDRVEEESDHFDQTGTLNFHQKYLNLLKDGFLMKRHLLQQMNLKSLSLDFSKLYCPIGCCRREALQSCLATLDWTRLRYKLEQERGSDLKTKLGTDVKIHGLKNGEEKRLVWETWGLKVD